MNTLYVLGGPPRTAKTTIMSGLTKELGIPAVAADAVEHGMRSVLTGHPHQMLRDVEFSGSAEWKTSLTQGGERKPFTYQGTESELTLHAVVGMLDYYRRNEASVAFEGAVFTPEWVSALRLSDFTIRAAFAGFTNPAHADHILSYAKDHPHDWLNDWLEEDEGDETNIRDWVARQSKKCQDLKTEAAHFGYPFFDISTMPFKEYVASVQNYFLEI